MTEEIPKKYRIVTKSRIYADINTPESITDTQKLPDSFEYGDPINYEIIKPLGSGKYSTVFLGLDKRHEKCAVKMLKTIPSFKVHREINILKKVQLLPNAVQIIDVVNDEPSETISIITEYFENLSFKKVFQLATIHHIRYIMRSLLSTLDACHRHGIMHRDIKPGNVLIAPNKQSIKIIDWGLAELYVPNYKYSVRVSTTRYKAPELLLGYEYYDYGIDIWGAGCVFAELLCKYPFFDGRNFDEMIASIAGLAGMESIVNYVEKYGLNIPDAAIPLLPQNQKPTWQKYFSMVRPSKRDDDAFDLLKKMLTVDHADRITAKEALEHPFFKSMQ